MSTSAGLYINDRSLTCRVVDFYIFLYYVQLQWLIYRNFSWRGNSNSFPNTVPWSKGDFPPWLMKLNEAWRAKPILLHLKDSTQWKMFSSMRKILVKNEYAANWLYAYKTSSSLAILNVKRDVVSSL